MTGGNGTDQQRFLVRMTEYLDRGYVVFRADEKLPPPGVQLPLLLSKAVEQWIASKPGLRVYTTLPIVKDGQTIAIHVWCDPATLD